MEDCLASRLHDKKEFCIPWSNQDKALYKYKPIIKLENFSLESLTKIDMDYPGNKDSKHYFKK